jgi:hypothetical protein
MAHAPDIRTIKAAEGRRVRDAKGKLLPAGGMTVAWGSYWERLKRDGDVVVVPDAEPEAPPAPPAPPAAAAKPAAAPAPDANKPS